MGVEAFEVAIEVDAAPDQAAHAIVGENTFREEGGILIVAAQHGIFEVQTWLRRGSTQASNVSVRFALCNSEQLFDELIGRMKRLVDSAEARLRVLGDASTGAEYSSHDFAGFEADARATYAASLRQWRDEFGTETVSLSCAKALEYFLIRGN